MHACFRSFYLPICLPSRHNVVSLVEPPFRWSIAQSSWNSCWWRAESVKDMRTFVNRPFFPLIHTTVFWGSRRRWTFALKEKKRKKRETTPGNSWLQHFLKFLRAASSSSSMILQMMWTAASFSLFQRRRLNCEIYCAYACLRSLKILEFEG